MEPFGVDVDSPLVVWQGTAIHNITQPDMHLGKNIALVERWGNGQYGYSNYLVFVSTEATDQATNDNYTSSVIPDMFGWEIIVPNDESASLAQWTHGEPHDHIFVTSVVGFGNHYAE